MAEMFPTQTGRDEESDGVEKDIFQDPPRWSRAGLELGPQARLRARNACDLMLFYLFVIWFFGAIAAQLYLGITAVIRFREFSSQAVVQNINVTGIALLDAGEASVQNGRKVDVVNSTGVGRPGVNCPKFDNFGTLYPEPEHMLLVFGACTLAFCFPPLNLFWYTCGWIAFAAYNGIEGGRLQKDCPGRALEELQLLIWLACIMGGSYLGLPLMYVLIEFLDESLTDTTRNRLTPIRLTRPAIADLEERPEELG